MRHLAAVQAVDRSFIDGSCKLAVKGRRLVFQGRLNKVCRNGWKSRQFFLFNDLLAYGTPLTAARYTNMRSLPLAGMEVSLADDSYAEFGIQITTAQKSFLVLAADDADRNMWLTEVRCTGEAIVCFELALTVGALGRWATSGRVGAVCQVGPHGDEAARAGGGYGPAAGADVPSGQLHGLPPPVWRALDQAPLHVRTVTVGTIAIMDCSHATIGSMR